jgi:aryl-alcohol dehydrogenase-like predicted oxidoreductase
MRQLTVGNGKNSVSVSALALGSVPFGTTVDEETAFAILDRFADAGGNLLDTANEYAYWAPGSSGGDAEAIFGRWTTSRKNRNRMVLSTKVGALPNESGAMEGLSKAAIGSAAIASMGRMQTDVIDIYWAHDEDPATSLEETVGAFGEMVDAGSVRVLGVSNHAMWRVERARSIADATGVAAFDALQYRYSYVQPRPGTRSPERSQASHEHLDLVRSQSGMALFAYTPLMQGAYTREDKPLPEAYDHPGTTRRLAALRTVADELGATPNQVVLAWMIGGSTPIIPIVGASSVAQLEESLGALDLSLDDEQRARLDAAN